MSDEFGPKVYADTFFYERLQTSEGTPGVVMDDGVCQGPSYESLQVLHLLEDAIRWRLLRLVYDKGLPQYPGGFSGWIGLLGAMQNVCMDQGSAVMSVEMLEWLERKPIKLFPLPASTGQS